MTTNQTQPPISAKEAKAQAKAAAAYAKAQQNWFMRHKILTAILALFVIGIIASAAGAGGDDTPAASDPATTQTPDGSTASQTPSSTEPESEPEPEPEVADNSTKGKGPLVWGNWETVGSIKLTDDGLNSYGLTFRAKNTGDSPDEGFFTVTVLKAQDILGTLTCSTSTVQPGAIGTADCFSTDDYTKGWTEITIENAF